MSQQFGLTLVQTVADGLVAGATLKLVRGTSAYVLASEGLGVSDDAFLESAEGLVGHSATRFDVDVGALACIGPLRVGVIARNVRQPGFPIADEATSAVRLNRQVRVGVAIVAVPAWTIAADADVTRFPAPSGEQRNVAVGLERWAVSRRAGVRGGVRASTVGASRVAGSLGGSVLVRRGIYLDAQLTAGAEGSDRGWSVGSRVTF